MNFLLQVCVCFLVIPSAMVLGITCAYFTILAVITASHIVGDAIEGIKKK